MKGLVLSVVALVTISFSVAEDDGRYRPSVHGGNDGRYVVPSDYYKYNNRYYNSLVDNKGKYSSIYNTYQPYYQALDRHVLPPFVNFDNRFDQNPFASSVAAVTYRPTIVPAVSTLRPIVYSSTQAPLPTAVPVYARTQYIADKSANIVQQESDSDGNNYRFAYQTDNGIAASEAGSVDTSSNGGGTRVRGFYEYIGDDGLKYRVDYTADENGFRPTGAHLPQ